LPAKAASLALQCSGCTHASGTGLDGCMVGSPARRVKLFCATPRIFWSTTGRALRGGLAPTRIVPGAIAAPTPAYCHISFCVSTASAGTRIKA